MQKVFLAIVIITQTSFCMQRLDEKPLPTHVIRNLSVRSGWDDGLLRRPWRSEPVSAKELYALCKKEAYSGDWACERHEEIRPDNCTVFGQAGRHLACWWLYKQALSQAINQK